jgi:heme exporter protein A
MAGQDAQTPAAPGQGLSAPAAGERLEVGDLLEVRNLVRGFGRLPVVAGVSALLGPGEALLVTGRNGAGKSTLLRCLAGLLRPQAGTIRLREAGRELDVAARRARVGYVAPDLAFYEPLTAEENLDFFARVRGIDPARGGRLLDELGVPRRRAAGALSSGMRQRLRWAFALLHGPRLLLLDEPFQNLDGAGEEVSRALLARHLAAGGMVVVATPTTLDVPGVVAALDLSAPAALRGVA